MSKKLRGILKDSLSNLAELKVLKETVTDSKEVAHFMSELNETVNTQFPLYFESTELVEKFITDGDVNAQYNSELLAPLTEAATAIYGEWNESAGKLALTAYMIATEAEVVNQGKFLTFGELYALESTHTLFDVESSISRSDFASLDDSCFIGENKTVPVTNLESFMLAKALGCDVNEDRLAPIQVLVGDKNATLVQATELEDADLVALAESFDLDETQTKILNDFAKEYLALKDKDFLVKENALVDYKKLTDLVILPTEFLLTSYKSREFNDSSYRDALLLGVGVKRGLKISQDSIDSAQKPYTVFSNTVLEKLLNAPVKTEEVNDSESTKIGESEASTSDKDGIVVEVGPKIQESTPHQQVRQKKPMHVQLFESTQPDKAKTIKEKN